MADSQKVTADFLYFYRVETFNLNKAVKRNSERFPEDFMFQLTKEEADSLRFQTGISILSLLWSEVQIGDKSK